jgi:ferredoxin
MMIAKIVSKEKIKDFLAGLIEQGEFIAPTKKNQRVEFAPVKEVGEIELNYYNSHKVPKELFFPQTEPLFQYNQQKEIKELLEISERIIFGLRPCDVRSLVILDQLFGGEKFQDPYYLKRREKTTIIGVACLFPQVGCFCTSFNGGTFSSEGSDILIIELAKKYLLKIFSEKGKKIVENHKMFETALDEDLQEAEILAKESDEKVGSIIKIRGITEKLSSMFEHPFWDEIYEKCLGCGICTYFCPTCHCFDIIEEKGKRIRNWDSCMFPLFTLHASGHNPRTSNKQRLRQRVMHKFDYYPTNFKEIACVGCGRCVRNCPVNLDLREVLKKIKRA